jgi:hypothetical protein
MEEALREELDRRAEEEKKKQEEEEQEPQEQGEQKQQLVPDVAELKLLQKMETEVLDRIDQVRELYPQIDAGEDLDPLIRRDLLRLATRSERIHQLFGAMRTRLGIDLEGGGPTAPEVSTEDSGETEDQGDDR